MDLRRYFVALCLVGMLAAAGCSTKSQAAPPEPTAATPDSDRGLLGTIYDSFRRLVGSDSRHASEVGAQMDAAQRALDRIKLENDEALRRASRQVRLKKCNSPNIILIVADDLGWGDFGCYGQRIIRTPHIDRFAAEGIRFTSFYAGCALGTPSRCSLMTGLTTGHCRIRGNLPLVPLAPADVTVAEVLWQAGYRTALIGKWALGEADTTGIPNRQGYEYFFGYLNREHAMNHFPEYLWRNQEQVALPANQNGQKVLYAPDLMTQEVLAYLDQNAGRPFFLTATYTLPHALLEIPSDAPYTQEQWPQNVKNYAAMVTRFDQYVGAIMARLQKLGIDQNTIVFITSDNGPYADDGGDPVFFGSAGPWRGLKGDLYEGGIRVPLLVRWPNGIRPGIETDFPCAFWDFLPTAADLVDALAMPPNLDGHSLLPLLLGQVPNSGPYLYWELHGGGFAQALRFGPWKVIRRGLTGPLEVYHLQTDPGETTNVAGKVPEIVTQAEQFFLEARSDSPEWPIIAPRNSSL